jgi:hypothetical protein
VGFLKLPDIREIALLMPAEPGRFRWGKLLSRAKFAARWIVVATAQTPMRHVYHAVYRWHVWFAIRAARKFPGTRAVYITRSMAAGAVAIGISDIDMVVVGDWPEQEQIRLMRSLGVLTAISPLYDSVLWQQVHHVDSLRNLWETDYFFQSRFDEGRRQWKLVYGEDVIAGLPAAPPERMGGASYMEVLSWWLHFIASTFGSGPTAADAIFRRSVAYKAVTEISSVERALTTGRKAESRQASLRLAMEDAAQGDRNFLERLERSASSGHLRFRGDIQKESLHYLLPLLDRIHCKLATLPSFESIGQFRVDARPDEILRTPSAIAHARRLIEHVKLRWHGYQAACLAPSAACFTPDELILLIQVKPDELPSLAQVRELCRLHAAARPALPQHITLYLLLPAGACQLEFVNLTEMWRVMLFPPSTPDLFSLIQDPEFQIDGHFPTLLSVPAWTRYSSDLAIEERNVRRSVLTRVTPDVFPSSIEIIRNVYRHLQLEVLTRSSAEGTAIFALSPAAIERALSLADASVLIPLREAYASEMRGARTDVRPLVPRIMTLLQSFS